MMVLAVCVCVCCLLELCVGGLIVFTLVRSLKAKQFLVLLTSSVQINGSYYVSSFSKSYSRFFTAFVSL